MKHKLLILFLFPFNLFSQSDKIKVSFQTGMGLSWLSSESKEITSELNNINFNLLAQADYNLNEKFAITGGLGLSYRQGGELQFERGGNLWSESKLTIPKGDSLPNGVSLTYRVNYVDLPIGFKVTTHPIGNFKFFVHPDISMGIRLGAKGDISGSNVSSEKENIKSQILFLTFNWGLNLGTEYMLDENIGLLFGIRFQQSLNDVTDDSGRYFDNTKVDYKDKINNLGVRVGLIF
ncbi:MAG: PorT family protein [Saprospiraceae bacterium]|nr:PorT family protein [Saprospiraceae bacterium]